MKKTVIIALVLLTIFNLSGCIKKVDIKEEVNLYPAFEMNGRYRLWGYIDDSGKFKIEPKYDNALDFSDNGIALVYKYNAVGAINSKGEEILDPRYKDITDLGSGYLAANDGKEIHIFNSKGEEQFHGPYAYIGKYKDNLFAVASFNDSGNLQMSYVDKSGNEKIMPSFKRAYDFDNGKAVVLNSEDKYEILDKSGKVLKELDYNLVSPCEDEGVYLVRNNDSLYGYIDGEGNTLIEPQFVRAELFKDGNAIVGISENDNTLFGVIDLSGNYIIEPEYAKVQYLGRNYYGVANERNDLGYKYAVANNKGELITDFAYYDLGSLNNTNGDAISVFDGINTYALDLSGKKKDNLPVLEGEGEIVFDGKVAKVTLLNRLYYYDAKGSLIWKESNDYTLREGAQVVEKLYETNGANIYYPVVEGLKNKDAEDKINKELFDDFVTRVEGDYKYYNTSYLIKKTNDLLTIQKYSEYYKEGDTTKRDDTKVYNISLISGKFYTLKDLFKENSDYVAVLSNIVREQMINNMTMGGDVYKAEGFTNIREDQDFIPQMEKIELLFNPTEILSQTQAFPKFTISHESLGNILDMEREFWWVYTLSRGF